jgi:MoxR-like ATPase
MERIEGLMDGSEVATTAEEQAPSVLGELPPEQEFYYRTRFGETYERTWKGGAPKDSNALVEAFESLQGVALLEVTIAKQIVSFVLANVESRTLAATGKKTLQSLSLEVRSGTNAKTARFVPSMSFGNQEANIFAGATLELESPKRKVSRQFDVFTKEDDGTTPPDGSPMRPKKSFLANPKGIAAAVQDATNEILKTAKNAKVPVPRLEEGWSLAWLADDALTASDLFARTLLGFCVWFILLEGTTGVEIREALGLPGVANLREVEINPSALAAALSKRRLEFPMHVLALICAAVNSGKHLILTGPPGCGKTQLARVLATSITKLNPPLLVTAGPSWTSGDLIGRYMPQEGDARAIALRFEPGHFLRAAESGSWLIVDEMNRANIDECFGELFTVLAGEAATLGFRDVVERADSSGGTAPVYGHVRVGPTKRLAEVSPEQAALGTRYRDYAVPPDFRFIGTANDADRASLHKLSFALLRRFAVIRVEAPPPDRIKNGIIADNLKAVMGAQDAVLRRYQFGSKDKFVSPLRSDLESALVRLFVEDPPISAGPAVPSGLVSKRIVGVAAVLDVIGFIEEGLQPFKKGEAGASTAIDGDLAALKSYVFTWLARAIVVIVLPQLDSCDDALFCDVVRRILLVLEGGRLARLVAAAEPEKPYTVAFETNVETGIRDRDGDEDVTLPEYLADELTRQYAGSARSDLLESVLAEYFSGGT